IHVMTPESQDAVLQPGRYRVSAASKSQLRLLADENGRETILAASPTTHDIKLDQPGAAIFVDENNPDLRQLVLAHPDGTALESVASISGIVPRGLNIQSVFKQPAIRPQSTVIQPPVGSQSSLETPTVGPQSTLKLPPVEPRYGPKPAPIRPNLC